MAMLAQDGEDQSLVEPYGTHLKAYAHQAHVCDWWDWFTARLEWFWPRAMSWTLNTLTRKPAALQLVLELGDGAVDGRSRYDLFEWQLFNAAAVG